MLVEISMLYFFLFLSFTCANMYRIGNEGAEAIATGLCENNTLMKLNLRSNLIGDAGAVSIAESLKRYK